jgi:thioredoxin reductase (NADPH)
MNVVWSKNDCVYCERAKQLLVVNKIEYEERNVENGEWTMEHLSEAAPRARTFPQVFLDDILIGGYNELYTHLMIKTASL